MIIECPRCHTKFNVKDELIPEDGRKVKCSKCKHIFIAKKAKEEEEEVFDLTGEVKEEIKLEKEDEKLEKELEKVAKRYQKPKPKKIKKEKTKSNKGVYLITFFMLIFAICFSALFLYLKTKNSTPPMSFENLKGNYYENKNYGTILVIQGYVKNNRNYAFTKVKVKGVIYDTSGEKIDENETYIGNIFSKQELLNLNEKQIKTLIYDQVVLKPKAKIPFMIVFYHPPKNSYSFQTEIVSYERVKR